MELLARIAATARDQPSRPAYIRVESGEILTYGQLHAAIQAGGQGSGEPAILHSANTLSFAPTFLSLLAAGTDVLTVPASATGFEVEALSRRISTARVQAGQATGGSPGHLLLVTSGTTGPTRIARRSAASLDAVARNIAGAVGFRLGGRVLAAIPLAHSYGIEHGLLAPLWAGATVLLADGLYLPHLTAAFAGGVDIFPAVPSMIESLAGTDLPGLGRLRTLYSAGARLPGAVEQRFVARHGLAVGQLYGTTEVGSVTYREGGDSDPSNVGRSMPGVSIDILASGEVAVHSPSMFSSYLDGPTPSLHPFPTGDLGFVRDGALHITGRQALLIDTGMAKVNPIEIEEVIASHPGVRECVVVPIRQTDTVSRLRALVVPDPNSPVSPDDLREFLRYRLAGHKIPRVIEFRAALPRSPTGKILRKSLENQPESQ